MVVINTVKHSMGEAWLKKSNNYDLLLCSCYNREIKDSFYYIYLSIILKFITL